MAVMDVVFVGSVLLVLAWACVDAWVVREAATDGLQRAATRGLAVLVTGPAGFRCLPRTRQPEDAVESLNDSVHGVERAESVRAQRPAPRTNSSWDQ